MSAEEAEDYHAPQIASFAKRPAADMVAAYTLNDVEEAIGIARAARALPCPCSISFTVETDGRLSAGGACATRSRRWIAKPTQRLPIT